MQALLNVTIDGIAYGMVLFIISVGMSVTLGLMRFVNASHGSFAMIGGYIVAYLITDAQWSFWWSCLAAIVAIHRPKLGELAADAIEKVKVKAVPPSTRPAATAFSPSPGQIRPSTESFFGKIDFPG